MLQAANDGLGIPVLIFLLLLTLYFLLVLNACTLLMNRQGYTFMKYNSLCMSERQ